MAVRALVAVGLLLVAACTDDLDRTSVPDAESDPNTTVPAARDATLSGRIVDGDGNPVGGLTVTVERTDTGVGGAGALAAVATLGLACLADPDICSLEGTEQIDNATTDADGRYEMTLPGAYVAGYETDDDWIVRVGLPAQTGQTGGPVSSYELEVSTAVQEAPELALWTLAPTVTVQGASLRVEVPPLRATAGEETDVQLVTQAGAVLWDVRGAVDRRVLEDVLTNVVVQGAVDIRVPHDEGRTIYHQRKRTASIAYQGDLVPPTRGAACRVEGGAALGCPFTDGDLLTPAAIPAGGAAEIDLVDARDIGQVIVRGRSSSPGEDLVVEGSADGQEWSRYHVEPLVGAEGWIAGVDDPIVTRYLRVRAPEGAEVSEISGWPVVRLLGSAPDDDGDDPVDTAAKVAAALLVLGVAAGSISAARPPRRRRGRARPRWSRSAPTPAPGRAAPGGGGRAARRGGS